MLSLVPVVSDFVCAFDMLFGFYLIRIPVCYMLMTVEELTVLHLLLNISQPTVVVIVLQVKAMRVMAKHFHSLFKLINDFFTIKVLDFL